jgi:hypothetical protein
LTASTDFPPRPYRKSIGIDLGLSTQFVERAQASDASITIDQDRALAVLEMLAPRLLGNPLVFNA